MERDARIVDASPQEAFFRSRGRRLCAFQAMGAVASVAEFQSRYTASAEKYRRARRAARWMVWLPSVRGVAVCNSVAFGSAVPESDIDLFIITANDTTWVTRLLVVGACILLRVRPQPGNERDALCASFFVAERAINLSQLALPGGDPYLAHWCASLLPVAERGETFTKFAQENEGLLSQAEVIGNITPPHSWCHRRVDTLFSRTATNVLRKFESFARWGQSRYFPKEIRERMNRDTSVVVTADILKFHTNDRRAQFRDRLCHSHSEQQHSSSSHSSRHLVHA